MEKDIKFHYTSVNAMTSIMENKNTENKKLRFTRSEFLNDPAIVRCY